MKGIQTNIRTHKISLYADDVLLFIKEPSKSIPALIEIIDEFSTFSGYKINYDKSLALPLGKKSSVSEYLPFKATYSGFKYLGIFFSSKLSDLTKFNFLPLITQIKLDFQRWLNLPVYLLGRIAIIKMNVMFTVSNSDVTYLYSIKAF